MNDSVFNDGLSGSPFAPPDIGDIANFELGQIVRWIVASCRTHFENGKGPYSIYFENAGPRNLVDFQGKPITNYVEFRIDGPYIRKLSQKELWYTCDLNLLCHSNIDNRDSDSIERMLGWFVTLFTDAIPVMKFGNTPGDDRTVQFGCLMLYASKGDDINVSRFGQANPDTKLAQASIDATYRMKLVL